jgi:hypothetical protein
MFMTEGTRVEDAFDSRYSPSVADSVDAIYPVKKTVDGLSLHLPSIAVTSEK